MKKNVNVNVNVKNVKLFYVYKNVKSLFMFTFFINNVKRKTLNAVPGFFRTSSGIRIFEK